MELIKAEVNFGEDILITAKQGDTEYVAMRPIVESLGLSWSSQSRKIRNNQLKQWCVDITTPTNNGNQKMLYIPIKKLNGWLFSINPEKVKASVKNKLIKYQEECFTALYDYWCNGKASTEKVILSEAEREAHAIARLDAITFKEASVGSGSMNKRKVAKKIIKHRIQKWQEKYQLQFHYDLTDTELRITHG